MKKVLFTISLALTSALAFNSANAQVFNLEYLNNSNDTVFATGAPSEIKTIVRLNLATGIDSFNYTWKFQEFSKPNDWTFNGMCDNITCHVYEIGGNVSDRFKAPYLESDKSLNVYNNPSDPAFNMDIPYLWLDVPTTASQGIGYFKYVITTADVYPVSAAPATPQVTEVVHVIKKAIGVSVDRIVINNDDIKIHPNPVQQSFNITTSKDFNLKSVNVIDATGRNVMSVGAGVKNIDVSNLASGMYWVEFINQDGIKLTTRKFVKQ